ncbi:MAG: ABC transporter permease [Anaerolineae bacterium]|nr:ABC transporter permease [Anaerolineae bacterium]
MKIWNIAWKDTTIRFRDRNALILMVAAPLVLSAIIGSAFGSFLNGSDPAPISAIPVLLVNQDDGEMGQQFATILTSDALGDLLVVTEMADETAARQQVQRGEARAAIVIPDGFSEAVSGDSETAESPALVQFYADPSATVTPNIVRGVVTQIVNGFNSAAISSEVTVAQLTAEAATLGPALANLGTVLQAEMQSRFNEGQPLVIALNDVPVGETEETADISPFAFFAPSMGILFLMFSMMDGTRSILEEEQEGTLSRLVSTPTSHLEIILGKIGGVFLTGGLQFVVFVVASALIFQLNWGNSLLGLAMLTLAVVLSLTSLGALIAAFARNPSQAGILGTVVTLVFAALGGTFVPAQNFPPFLQELSKITVTRWALDGFTDLTIYGLGAADVVLETAVLTGLSILFVALALWQFQRRLAK